jgi:hypothetical protein
MAENCAPKFEKLDGVYAVTRHCGGPEEGGWWFNALEHVESAPLPYNVRRAQYKRTPRVERLVCSPEATPAIERAFDRAVRAFTPVRRRLAGLFSEVARGDIYSVLGGTALSVQAEARPGQHTTTERPRYE